MEKKTFHTISFRAMAVGALTVAFVVFLFSGCIYVFRKVKVEEIDVAGPPVAVTSPVKAHLWDGTVAVFPQGATFSSDSLRGMGRRYSLNLEPVAVDGVPIDSIAAVETYSTAVRPAETFIVSTLATGAGAVGASLLAVAIFGSCPTVYSVDDQGLLLEAESFSNSIAPLFEMRDVDRLHALADSTGLLELEVRNEALETHYVNHLELLEVVHDEGAFAVPGDEGDALLLYGLAAPSSLTDRAGHDVSHVLKGADGLAYSTHARTLNEATVEDMKDYIDLVVPAPQSDTAAVVLRLKNSLLNTVFFYDFLLAAQGARALDWLGKDLGTIRSAVQLGEFFARHMGVRIMVWEAGAYREVGRVGEVGPIAWDDVGVVFPVPPGDSLRIRLSFLADAWRIDRVAVASRVRRRAARPIPIQRVLNADRAANPEALQSVSRPDEDYLITGPGDRYWIRFDTGPVPPDARRTFFLAAQGYYTEWIRGDWIRDPAEDRSFVASDETLFAVIQKWKSVKASFEQQFEASKIPVR